MTTPTSLPPERDLPPAVHAAVRARLVASVAAGPVRSRRWAPVAAAAALVALVGGSAVVVAGIGDPAPIVPAGAPPDRAALLATCVAAAEDAPGKSPPSLAGARVRALLTDDQGSLLYFGTAQAGGVCRISADGDVLSSAKRSTGGATGYLPPEYGPASAERWGNMPVVGAAVMVRCASPTPIVVNGRTALGCRGVPGSQPTPEPAPLIRYAVGNVRSGVVRLTFTWAGAPPVEAAVEGPFFAARVILPPGRYPTEGPAEIVAYDAAGVEVGRSRVIG
jgi:hypothetical protein